MTQSFLAILLASAAMALAPAAALAHGDAAAHDSKKKPSSARVTLADTALVDQDGASRNLRSDVVGDRIVVVDFVYTTCTTVCPVVSATFAKVQRELGDRLGKDVSLVSITVDPARDTPEVLKAYSAKHGAKDGWLWLTGSPQAVTGALKGFGAYVADPAQHAAMVLVGDARANKWTRFFGFPTAEQLVAKVNELSAARSAAGATGKGNG
jgi:protein SCO1/2